MSQLPDVRVSRPVRAAWQPPPSSSHPPRGRSAGAVSEAAAATSEATSEQGPPSFDDYDADLELAWLGYVLAKCQPPTAHGDRNLVKQSIDHDLQFSKMNPILLLKRNMKQDYFERPSDTLKVPLSFRLGSTKYRGKSVFSKEALYVHCTYNALQSA